MSGFLLSTPLLWVPVLLLGALVIGFLGLPGFAWAALGLVTLLGLGAGWFWLLAFAAISAVFVVKPLREKALSGPLLKLFRSGGFLPAISQTEREALEAGTVWCGRPALWRATRTGRRC